MNNNNDIQKNILDKIKAGEIKMRSKAYFMTHVILLIVLSLLVLLTSSFFISFIFFSIHESGRFFLLGFGWRGLEVFIITFPWTILLIDIFFIILLELLLKRFQFGYRSPIVYTVGGIILISVVAGFIIDKTPLHNALLHQEQRQALPLIGGFYDGIRRPPHEFGVFRGVVVSIKGNTFIMDNSDLDAQPDNASSTAADASSTTIAVMSASSTTTDILKIILEPNTPASSIVATSDTVFVAGDITGNVIHAYGIKKLMPADMDNQ